MKKSFFFCPGDVRGDFFHLQALISDGWDGLHFVLPYWLSSKDFCSAPLIFEREILSRGRVTRGIDHHDVRKCHKCPQKLFRAGGGAGGVARAAPA